MSLWCLGFSCLHWPDLALAQQDIVIAAGQSQGNYYKFATVLAELAPAEHVRAVESGGSLENIELLRDHRADFAIVQSDVALRAIRGHLPFDDPIPGLLQVTPLFEEAVHILVRSELFIFTTSGIRGKKVALGPKGSGTVITARAILDASEASTDEVQAEYLPMDGVNAALRDETTDVAFVTSSIPSAVVRRALADNDARLLLIEPKVIDRLVKSGSYSEAQLPQGAYPNLTGTVATIGVQALLLTRSDVAPAKVALIASLLNDRQRDIEKRLGLGLGLLWYRLPISNAIATHPLVERYRRNPWYLPGVLVWLALALGAVVIVATYWRAKVQRLGQALLLHTDVVIGVFGLLFVWLCLSFGLLYYEHNVNENFADIRGSMWSVLVYISGGFQSRAPITNGGEKVAVVGVIVGVAFVAWLIADLTGKFVHSKLKFVEQLLQHLLLGRSMVPASIRDHFVIINWDDRTQRMIQQLHGPDLPQRVPIVVVTRKPMRFPDTSEFEGCYNVSGDMPRIEVLERAGARVAHSVTILSSWIDPDAEHEGKLLGAEAADMKTVLAILTVRSLSAQHSAKCVPITAEIKALRNLEAAGNAGRGGPTELVCAEQFAADLLTQCCVTPGLAAVYNDLLTFSRDSDEVYKVDLPRVFHGETFATVVMRCASRDRKTTAVIPIGVFREGAACINPGREIDPLREGDALLVICDSPNAWKTLVSRSAS